MRAVEGFKRGSAVAPKDLHGDWVVVDAVFLEERQLPCLVEEERSLDSVERERGAGQDLGVDKLCSAIRSVRVISSSHASISNKAKMKDH